MLQQRVTAINEPVAGAGTTTGGGVNGVAANSGLTGYYIPGSAVAGSGLTTATAAPAAAGAGTTPAGAGALPAATPAPTLGNSTYNATAPRLFPPAPAPAPGGLNFFNFAPPVAGTLTPQATTAPATPAAPAAAGAAGSGQLINSSPTVGSFTPNGIVGTAGSSPFVAGSSIATGQTVFNPYVNYRG